LDDCPEVDVDNLFADLGNLEYFDPISELRLPAVKPVVSTWGPASSRSPNRAAFGSPPPRGGGTGQAHMVPMAAWGTPPSTATGAKEFAASGQSRDDTSAGGTPRSSRPASAATSCAPGLPRRSRSLSSTAESAVLEDAGLHRPANRAEQAKEEWGFEDSATAQHYLAAQRHRLGHKPPALPGKHRSQVGPGTGGSGRSASGTAAGRSSGSLKEPRSGSARAGSGKSAPKAQDAIAEFRRMQEEQDRLARERDRSAASAPMEFCSGSPNLKLMKSSSNGFPAGSPTHHAGSPRCRSPALSASSSR